MIGAIHADRIAANIVNTLPVEHGLHGRRRGRSDVVQDLNDLRARQERRHRSDHTGDRRRTRGGVREQAHHRTRSSQGGDHGGANGGKVRENVLYVSEDGRETQF